MRLFNSDSKIIFNVIAALIIGIIFGNFLGSSMLNNEAIYANAYNYNDEVYLLQSAFYYDEYNASVVLSNYRTLGLNGLIVREHDKYYVYHGIAFDEEQFSREIKILEDNGIDYFIKTRKMFDLIDDLDKTSTEYKFYHQSINYFLSLVHNTKVTISKTYTESVTEVNMELYNNINALNESVTTSSSLIYKLYIYQSLIDLLL